MACLHLTGLDDLVYIEQALPTQVTSQGKRPPAKTRQGSRSAGSVHVKELSPFPQEAIT